MRRVLDYMPHNLYGDKLIVKAEKSIFKNLGSMKFGEIHVKVEYNSSGFIDLTWTDNGIGMDQYVAQNYLAVVGKSYYQSDDFLR